MIRISLREEEKEALNQLRRSQNTNVVERAHYILLCNEGKSVPQIAAHLSRNRHTIRLWIRRNVEILFADESHFSNQPYVIRGWFKCGEKKR